MKKNTVKMLAATLAALAMTASLQAGATGYQFVYKASGLKAAPTTPLFTSHVFTNCGKTGYAGPTLEQCVSAYAGASVLDPLMAYSVVSGIQAWTVPETGVYRITATGAKGGSSRGGNGASISGEFQLTQGEVLKLLVGQMGQYSSSTGGGGGASFVVKGDNVPLLVAAGGGGGNTAYSGGPGQGSLSSNGIGGTDCAGGAGFAGNGSTNNTSAAALSFLSGGTGGRNYGGFGGGGGGQADGSASDNDQGGGGGYQGGPGNCNGGGSGGLSFNAGANQSNQTGQNPGHGSITIEKL
jgi:hypothetical protein